MLLQSNFELKSTPEQPTLSSSKVSNQLTSAQFVLDGSTTMLLHLTGPQLCCHTRRSPHLSVSCSHFDMPIFPCLIPCLALHHSHSSKAPDAHFVYDKSPSDSTLVHLHLFTSIFVCKACPHSALCDQSQHLGPPLQGSLWDTHYKAL